MRPEIKFHCSEEGNFKNDLHQVSAFIYTDYFIEAHNHDFYEMNIVMKGTGTHQIEEACFKVKAGDVFVIPPMTIHAYYDTADLDVYHILLHKRFVADNESEAVHVKGYLQLMEIEPFLRRHFSEAMFLHLTQNQLLQLKSELKFIESGGVFDSDDYVPLKNHTTWKIIYWLSYLLFEQMNSGEKKSANKYEHAVLQALEYIHQSYGEKITIETLCRKTFLSRSTFLRSFDSICGMTPTQYLNDYRCKKAIEMMEHSDLSKTEIAHSCGFYDLSHMERMTKRLVS